MVTPLLRELAQLYGIELQYRDAAGRTRKASRTSLEAVIRARGGEATREGLRARKSVIESRIVEPVTVVWAPGVARVPVRADRPLAYELTLEDGTHHQGRLAPAEGAISVPHDLPLGVHELRLDGAHVTRLFVAPRRVKPHRDAGRSWGLFVPLHAAHTRRSWGIGDLGDLQAYRSWVNEMGGGIVATLPMLASFENEPSPYSPVSRLYWNEVMLDLERLPEFEAADRDENDVASLRRDRTISYERVHAVRRRVLARMSERFLPDEGFQCFAKEASAYAEFRAAREGGGTASLHLYAQYRMAQQMKTVARDARAHGLGLYLDFPLGVHPDGFDTHHFGGHFAAGTSVGAPPDLFFTKGQNWGFPPLDPDRSRERGYDYLRMAIRHHAEHAGVLRLDHVMGLHRLFWIPAGAAAADGVYVRYRTEELYALLLIEANRTGTIIVGEDLGTVPPDVPATMARHEFRRMFVVQYEAAPEKDPVLPPAAPLSVASVNTHDMPTFASFWSGRDIDDRRDHDLLDDAAAAEETRKREMLRAALLQELKAYDLLHGNSGDTVAVLQAVLAHLAQSDAETVLVNLEDLWMEPEPQNVPGSPERSWRRRMRLSLEEAREDNTVKRLLRVVGERRGKGNGNTQ